MWCAKCHADVAAEVSPDNARARCANCGSELGIAAAVRAADKTREARALLERWSANRVLDPFGPVSAREGEGAGSRSTSKMPENAVSESVTVLSPRLSALAPIAPESTRNEPAAPARNVASGPADAGFDAADPILAEEPPPPLFRDKRVAAPRRFRVDAAHPIPQMHPCRPAIDSEPPQTRTQFAAIEGYESQDDETEDAPMLSGSRRRTPVAQPIDVQSAILDGVPRRTNWFQLAGHLLAYAGALVLTIGMALVLVGCFGGPQKMHFTPTGWLIATFGQLLLVSGVITLLSSGMERSTREVAQRIEALGERLLRFEQEQSASLRGPHVGARSRSARMERTHAAAAMDE